MYANLVNMMMTTKLDDFMYVSAPCAHNNISYFKVKMKTKKKSAIIKRHFLQFSVGGQRNL